MQVMMNEAAARRVTKVAEMEGRSGAALRISVEGGGCAGYRYAFELDDSGPADGDVAFKCHGETLLVDATSLPLLDGAEVRWVERLSGSHFVVDNPNARSGCGCGTSFTARA